MGLPDINIAFKTAAATAIQRGERGVVTLILKDTVPTTNPIVMNSTSDIPTTGLTTANLIQINLAWMGGVNVPKKVIAYVLPTNSTDYSAAQTYLETVKWDYVAVPGIASVDTTAFATWIKTLRDSKDIKVKAVLPNTVADHEGIINFATDDIKVGSTTYDVADYCSRIAGILAGNPLTMSATYQVLTEVTDVPHLTKSEFDTAIDAGKLVLMNDGEKVKIARAVNSLTITTTTKGADFKKIKLVDTMDLMHDDIKKTTSDNYIGKVANSYQNKVLLMAAIKAYYESLENDGLLDVEKNTINIDITAQSTYLQSIGVDINPMTTQQIKEANTSDKVFLASNIKILDAMEDIALNVTL